MSSLFENSEVVKTDAEDSSLLTDLGAPTTVDEEKGFDAEVAEEEKEEDIIFEGTITITSKSGKKHIFDKNVVAQSKFIKNAMKKDPELTNIDCEYSDTILEKISKYLVHYSKHQHNWLDAPLPPKPLSELYSKFSYDFYNECMAVKNNPLDKRTSHQFYHDILTAAYYFDIKSLKNDLIIGYSKLLIDNCVNGHDRIRQFTGEPDDLTDAEKKEINSKDLWD